MTATDALELGIDIGLLDCAISVGFPGTVASLRQQWGRAGRRERGLAILVASDDALDQFFAREPDALLSRRVEAAILDHANPRILDPHVLAAAFEAPIDDEGRRDARQRGAPRVPPSSPSSSTRRPATSGRAATTRPRASRSARATRRRSPSSTARPGSLLGLVERDRAYSTVHEGAVYLHLGEQYLVEALSLEDRVAVVSPARVDWYTQVKKESETTIEESVRASRAARCRAPLRSRLRHRAGRRLRAEGGARRRDDRRRPDAHARDDLRDRGGLVLPRARRSSRASSRCRSSSERSTPPSTASSPCSRCGRCATAGTSAASRRTSTTRPGRPTIFVYDGHAGGVGITERGFDRFEDWVEDTARLLAALPVRGRLPLVRPEPEVRQPQRAARQGRARGLLLERMLGVACRSRRGAVRLQVQATRRRSTCSTWH